MSKFDSLSEPILPPATWHLIPCYHTAELARQPGRLPAQTRHMQVRALECKDTLFRLLHNAPPLTTFDLFHREYEHGLRAKIEKDMRKMCEYVAGRWLIHVFLIDRVTILE